MAVRTTQAGSVELAYETFGDAGRPPVLLVMGIGSQMINWHEDFCTALSLDRFVIRFDNRDVGESQWLEGEVDLAACAAGDTSSAVYTLDDMAGDAGGLLDALGLSPAHGVGAPPGGGVPRTDRTRPPPGGGDPTPT